MLFELVGLILSPVTVAYTQWTQFYGMSKKVLFQRAQACVLEQDIFDNDLERKQNLLRSVSVFGDGIEYSNWLPCNSLTLWPSRAILEVNDESSLVATVLQYVDYNNYNWIMTHVVTRIAPYINSNMWYFRIIQQTPYYYFRYYFGDGSSQLPVYRNACILREGLRVARQEAEDLRGKIAAKKLQVEAEGGEVDTELSSNGHLLAMGSSAAGILSSFHSSSSSADNPEVDFGPDGSWLALNGTCLSRHEGEYVYKVCAFSDVYQDRVKLGTFSHWGDKPLKNKEKKITSESKMMAFKNKIHNKQKQQMKVASDYLTSLVSGSSKDGNIEDGSEVVSYAKQFYGDGTMCHNGIVRHAEIVDVVEYEVRTIPAFVL